MTTYSAKDRALGYLQYGDRTAVEMRAYLKKKGYEADEIEEAMEVLKEYQFIDDENYCKRYVESGVQKRKSSRKMMMELQQKGIDKNQIKTCLDEQLTPEISFENALEEARKYMARRGLDTEKAGMSKVMQRLAYLGYESGVAYKVAKVLKKGFDEDADFD